MRGQRGVPGWSEHRRVAIDPYWLVIQQDSSVGANALADGGVDGRRSKWSVQKWPSRRTAARPIAAAADDATRRRPPQDVCRPRCRRTWWSGVCGPRDALGRSPLLEQNFACAFAKNRDEKSMTAAADSAVHDHHGVDRHRHWTSSRKTSRARGPCPHIDDRSCISRALPPPRGRSRMVTFWRAWRVGSALFEPRQERGSGFRSGFPGRVWLRHC